MRARDRRFGTSSAKTRVGIATAALAGGAVAIAAVLAGGHGAGTAATSAAYSSRAGNEGSILSSAMTSWNGSRQSSYAQLSHLTQAQGNYEFICPPGLDLSSTAEQGNAVLLAWEPDYSPAPPIKQFSTIRGHKDTLWRMTVPIAPAALH